MNKPTRKNLLVFGYGLALICLVVGVHKGLHQNFPWWTIALLALCLGLAILTAIKVEFLIPLYDNWMKVARVIGCVISSLILIVLFYCVFGIMGLILKILGKDFLDQKIEPHKASYWISKEKKSFDKESYTKQF